MRVKFILIEDQVTALFPDEIADYSGNIMSYAHIGQHSSACPLWLSEKSVDKKEHESLLAELISIGYSDPEIIQ